MTRSLSIKQSARSLQKIPFLLELIRKTWRFTRPRYTAGAVGVIFNESGAVLIVEHAYHAYTPWGLPGGYLDNREDPDHAVAREMLEELSLKVEVGPIVHIERNYASHLDLAYLCRVQGSIGALSSELISYRWSALDDLPDLSEFHRRAIAAAVNRIPVHQWA